MSNKLIIILLFFVQLVYSQKPEQQKIIVSLDRPHYIAGQTLNCSAYLIDVLTHARLNNSEDLIYFHLFDANNNEIAVNQVIADNGMAMAKIELPENLNSGYYELTVYTNYLRNMGSDAIFRYPIKIFNSNQSNEPSAPQKPVKFNVSFYPEGGALIAGITTRVGVLVENSTGTSGSEGKILDNSGHEIATFKTNHYGLASFYFKPEVGQQYTALLTVNGDKKYKLPAVISSGVSISAKSTPSAIQIILECSDNYQYKKDIEIKLLSTQHVPLYASSGNLNKNGMIVKIPLDELPVGLYTVEIRNSGGKLESQRSIFISETEVNNPFDVALTDSVFNISSSIDLKLRVRNYESHRDIVVTRIADKSYEKASSIYSLGAQLYLNEDLANICERINLDFGKLVSEKKHAIIDQVMLMNNNNADEASHTPTSSYQREQGYYFLKGELSDSKPLPDTTEIFFFVPEINMIYQTKVDQSGKFSFPLLVPFYGKQRILFIARNEAHEFENPVIVQPDKMKGELNLKNALVVTDEITDELDEFRQIKEIKNSYGYYKPSPPPEAPPSFMIDKMLNYDYDFEIEMSEYVLFGTMQEVIKELLPAVMLRTRKQQPYLRIYAKDIESTFENSPLFFIGGYPTSDVNDFLRLRPVDIKRIKTIENYNKAIRLGPFGTSGVIVVELHEGVDNPAKANTQLFEVMGLTYGTTTQTPVTEKMPQFDLNLYWSPFIPQSSMQEIKLDTSERPSEYIFKVEAVIDGTLHQFSAPVNVKFMEN